MTADIKLDPGFKDFYKYCKSSDIPVVIISRYAFSSPPPTAAGAALTPLRHVP